LTEASASQLLDFAVRAFVSIFVIVDPVGNVPIFLALTSDYDAGRRREVCKVASLLVLVLLSFIALTGQALMDLFGVSIPAVRIAGGVLLFIIGAQMVHVQRTRSKFSPEEQAYWKDKEDVAVVPLGIPMLAGPGSITAVLVLAQMVGSIWETLIILGAIALTALITYLMLMNSQYLFRLMGTLGINVTTRLMGLLLAVIAVQLILDGIASVMPRMVSACAP